MENEIGKEQKAGSGVGKVKKTDQEKALDKSCPHCWGPLNPVQEKYVRCNACDLTFEVIPRDDGGVKLQLQVKEKKGEKLSQKGPCGIIA